MIPRRPLRQPHGSAADWTASGTWADGKWTVQMRRDLRTDHPLDTTQLEPGGVYAWAPAVDHGAGQRWHWVGYPRRLGLGVEQVRAHALAGQRLEGQGADELLRGARHDHAHLGARAHQQARQLGGLVGGDAAGHAEDDTTSGQVRHAAKCSRRPPRPAPVRRRGGC